VYSLPCLKKKKKKKKNYYGVSIGTKKCCGGLFIDDIVLIVHSERKMKALLRHVFCWANKNEMSFGINKCAIVKMLIITLNNLINMKNFAN